MNRKVLLIEPNYKNKYPPMGLMKISTYYRKCKDSVRFFKGDLKELAVDLLCEEYLAEINEPLLGKHLTKLKEHIKTGKLGPLDLIPDFKGTEACEKLKIYRTRFRTEKYPKFDVVGVTTLFTFYWKETIDTINFAKKFCAENGKMMVGGIAASILPDHIFSETGIRPHKGLLDKPGILDQDNDWIVDELPLDYSILEEIDYKYPAQNAYLAYMTRGCPRHCKFCAVPTLEPKYRDDIGLKEQLDKADARFGKQKDLLLMDNNVFASERFDEIIDEIKACGFEKGATYDPPSEYDIAINNLQDSFNDRAFIKKTIGIYDQISEKLSEDAQADFYLKREELNLLYVGTATKENIFAFDEVARPLYAKLFHRSKRIRYIDFNQGVDARFATDEKMKKLSEVNIRPLRIAFDHYSMRGKYEKAVRLAAKYKINDLSNYLLYNFLDKPEELYFRMKLNVELCEKLGVTIYSFPMKYHPIDDPAYFRNREYIGKNWSRKFIRAVQAVLNSTKGKIGKGRDFFEEAFGKDIDGFYKILWMPETFIIYRFQYKDNLTAEWWQKFNTLSEEQSDLAKEIINKNKFKDGDYECNDDAVNDVLSYYKITRGSAEALQLDAFDC